MDPSVSNASSSDGILPTAALRRLCVLVSLKYSLPKFLFIFTPALSHGEREIVMPVAIPIFHIRDRYAPLSTRRRRLRRRTPDHPRRNQSSLRDDSSRCRNPD